MEKPFEYASGTHLFDQVTGVLKPGNSAFVYTFPFSGHDYRIASFMARLPMKSQKNTAVISPFTTPTLDESLAQISKFMRSRSLVIISHAQILLREDTQYWLKKVLDTQEDTQTPILWIAEVMPFQLKTLHLSVLSHLLAHQFWLPQFSYEEMCQFINYLNRKFSNSNYLDTKAIYKETAGQIWLVKEIIRQSAASSASLSEIIASPAYKAKAELLYQAFPSELKETLASIVANKPLETTQREYYDQAQGMGIVLPNGNLPNYIVKAAGKRSTYNIRLSANDIYIDQVIITHLFTPAERRALTLLLQANPKRVSRGDLARCFWSTEDYTDWALDRAVFRLKRKSVKLGLPRSWIKTIRGVGYQISQ